MHRKFHTLWEKSGQQYITINNQEYPVVAKDEWQYRSKSSSCRYRAQCINGNAYLIEIDG